MKGVVAGLGYVCKSVTSKVIVNKTSCSPRIQRALQSTCELKT